VAAVLDWELCTLGDVLADVGYLLNSWTQPGEITDRDVTMVATTAGGFTSREELVDAYTAATGFEVTNAGYYRAFQYWRLAAIAEGVYARYQKGVMGGDLDTTSDYPSRVESMATEALNLLATV
jgi:aminoglycoside phosphotransferase (APT) family kinase protein